jgi:hypothetical protein
VPEVACIGCGGRFEDREGPTHRYMESSPGCWAIYGEVLAREYSDPAYGGLHRLTADTYAVQHPGTPSPQSIQSVAVHLMSLCLVLEQGTDPVRATAFLQSAVAQKGCYRWLTRPRSLGSITVKEVHRAESTEEHVKLVRAWAESAWSAWSSHHGTIRSWIGSVRQSR